MGDNAHHYGRGVQRSDTVVGVYSMILLVLCAVFPFNFVITGSKPSDTFYLQVLGIYMALGSIVFLTYISIRIHLYKKDLTPNDLQEQETLPINTPQSSKSGAPHGPVITVEIRKHELGDVHVQSSGPETMVSVVENHQELLTNGLGNEDDGGQGDDRGRDRVNTGLPLDPKLSDGEQEIDSNTEEWGAYHGSVRNKRMDTSEKYNHLMAKDLEDKHGIMSAWECSSEEGDASVGKAQMPHMLGLRDSISDVFDNRAHGDEGSDIHELGTDPLADRPIGEEYMLLTDSNKGMPIPEGENMEAALSVCPRKPPRLTDIGRGHNLFMRIGMVAFGMGYILHWSFYMLSYAEYPAMYLCFGYSFLFLGIINMIAILLQTHFLFKHHNIRFNFQHWLVKLGLAHLILYNIFNWLITVMDTAKTSVNKVRTRFSHRAHNMTHINDSSTFEHLGCVRRRVLADYAGPYLYPIVIGYCMFASATLFRIYLHVGQHKHPTSSNPPPSVKSRTYCKSNSGLFMGLTLLMLTLTSVIIFFSSPDDIIPTGQQFAVHLKGLIYLCTTFGISSVALLTLIPAIVLMRRLPVVTNPQGYELNDVLLFITLMGHYFLLVFMFFPCASVVYIVDASMSRFPMKAMGSVLCISEVIQGTIQTGYIISASRRQRWNTHVTLVENHTNNRHKREENAGRALVTFLCFCNLCNFVINCMELKESYNSSFFIGYYGALTWVVILSIFLPMSLFFRVHSSVCLSEIWLHTY